MEEKQVNWRTLGDRIADMRLSRGLTQFQSLYCCWSRRRMKRGCNIMILLSSVLWVIQNFFQDVFCFEDNYGIIYM